MATWSPKKLVGKFWKKLIGLYFFRADFAREPGKDDYEDEKYGVVKDIEEPFGKSTSKERKLGATAGAHRLMG